jgi:hypothetical protein
VPIHTKELKTSPEREISTAVITVALFTIAVGGRISNVHQ